MEDFVFAKEVRLGTYRFVFFHLEHKLSWGLMNYSNICPAVRSEKGNPQAHAVVGALLEAEDRGSYIYGDRVPHAIARREPGGRLAETAHHVKEFLWEAGDGYDFIFQSITADDNLVLVRKRPLYIDEKYYIEQILIPPLARVFNHVGADVGVWYKTMPKIRRVDAATSYEHDDATADKSLRLVKGKGARYGIDAHFRKAGCISCGRPTEDIRGYLHSIASISI